MKNQMKGGKSEGGWTKTHFFLTSLRSTKQRGRKKIFKNIIDIARIKTQSQVFCNDSRCCRHTPVLIWNPLCVEGKHPNKQKQYSQTAPKVYEKRKAHMPAL